MYILQKIIFDSKLWEYQSTLVEDAKIQQIPYNISNTY